MTFYYECEVEGYNSNGSAGTILGTQYRSIVRDKYKSIKTFFQYYMTRETIKSYSRNIREQYHIGQDKKVTMKIYNLIGHGYNEEDYKLIRSISL